MNKRALLLSEGGCNVPQNLRIQNYLQRRKCMTFEIHSNITNRSMTVAARAMRRALRRKRSIVWAIFGWSVFLFSALLLIPFDGEPFALDVRTVTSLLVEVMLLSVLLFQDRFNGMIARKNTLAGTKEYAVKDKAANLNHFSFLLLKGQIKLNPVKMIAEIPKNSHIYCLLKFSYPAPL